MNYDDEMFSHLFLDILAKIFNITNMNKTCARCQKVVYAIEELKCLDKVCKIQPTYLFRFNSI